MDLFIRYLLQGLSVCVTALTDIEIVIDTVSFRAIDLTAYGLIIGATLRFISSRYHGTWRGDRKQINRKDSTWQ